MSGHPAVYMWIVEFEDGTALAQYDPGTGKRNPANPDWLPSVIDSEGYVIVNGERVKYREAYPLPEVYKQKHIVRAGWVPFTPQLAKKIWRAESKVVIPTANPPHLIELKDGEQLRMHYTQLLHYMSRAGKAFLRETEYILGRMNEPYMVIQENGNIKKNDS